MWLYISKITLVVSKITNLPRYQVNVIYRDNWLSFKMICRYDYMASKELIKNILYPRIVRSRIIQQRYYVNYYEMWQNPPYYQTNILDQSKNVYHIIIYKRIYFSDIFLFAFRKSSWKVLTLLRSGVISSFQHEYTLQGNSFVSFTQYI